MPTVVLLESPHTSEAGERAGRLVTVEDTKVGVPERELAMASLPVAEHWSGW